MTDLGLVFLHCGDQIIGCILIIILGFIAVIILPLGLIVLLIFLFYKNPEKESRKDEE